MHETDFNEIGRCYCGACSILSADAALTVAFCHCNDCKRWTGAPAPAFAAFPRSGVAVAPYVEPAEYDNGVTRTNCQACGSPLLATFPYLPEQAYVPLGVLDAAAEMPAQIHCHADAQLPWLHQNDGLPREAGTGRDALNEAGK